MSAPACVPHPVALRAAGTPASPGAALLGICLRAERRRAGLGLAEGGAAIGRSAAHLEGAEGGLRTLSAGEVRCLLLAYGSAGGSDAMTSLPAIAHRIASYDQVGGVFADRYPGWAGRYLVAAAAAQSVTAACAVVAPAGLRTAVYGAALLPSLAGVSEDDRSQLVTPLPPSSLDGPVWTLLVGARVLEQTVAGMAGQIRHLLQLAEHPGVRLTVVPRPYAPRHELAHLTAAPGHPSALVTETTTCGVDYHLAAGGAGAERLRLIDSAAKRGLDTARSRAALHHALTALQGR